MSKLIISLLKLDQSSLSKWSKALPGEQTLDAKYKQLQRFARFFTFSPRIYAGVIWQLVGQDKEVYLTLDPTEWKMRGVWIQVLVLGIAHQGVSIALLWQRSNKQGKSAKVTREALVKCFKRWIQVGEQQQIWWTADREFAGKAWFETLNQAGMQFCVRLRKNTLIKSKTGKSKLYTLFENKSRLTFFQPVDVYGHLLFLSGQKLLKGDYFIVGSMTYRRDLAKIYQKRWEIETLFAAFKSRGFHLEDCRINIARRIKTLLFVLSIGAIWAIKTGLWLIEEGKKIPIKHFKDKKEQRWKSVFRWGLDQLQNILLNDLDYQKVIKLCPV